MSDAQKIRKLFEHTYPDNVKSRDFAAYGSMYTCDALWSPPNADDCQGPDSIISGFAKLIANADIDPVFTADEISIFGDTAYVWGRSSATVTSHSDNSVKKVNFDALWIVRREDDNWLIARQLWNNKL